MEKNDFDILKNLLIKDRSYRKFDESHHISRETLLSIVELTRYCASGRNIQPIKYYLINDAEKCEEIFPLLKWAGYLTDWEGPERGERPTAYLIQCLDNTITKNFLCDDGIQLQAITLGSVAYGLGGCIIKSFNLVKLKEILNLTENFEPLYIIAIGKPIEKVKIEDLKGEQENEIKYYRTSDGIHHVPKRILEDLIINK